MMEGSPPATAIHLRMRASLREAGVHDEGMTLKEIEDTYRAINSSRDVSVTVDSDDDNENVIPPPKIPSQSGLGTKNTVDTGGMQWQSKAKATAGSKFNYKIPKVKTAMAVTPFDALKEDNCSKEATTSTRPTRTITTLNTRKAAAADTRENEFAALDNGDPGDLPRLKLSPTMARLLRRNADMAAANPSMYTPPPYADSRVRALPYEQRYAIIGKYMRDMQEYLLRLSRASPRKAPWGKPITVNPHFNGSLDRVPYRASSPVEEMEVQLEQPEDIPLDVYTAVRSPVSPRETFLQNPLHDIIEREPSGGDSDEVRTNPRARRKRKAFEDATDLSDSDSNDAPHEQRDDDPDYEDTKRKKLSSTTNKYRTLPKTDSPRPSTSQFQLTFEEVIKNRPGITLKALPGRGTTTRGRGRGRGAKGGGNADIMARSSLFKDCPTKVGATSRQIRMLTMCDALNQPKAQAELVRTHFEESIKNSKTEIDDETAPQLIDDEADFEDATESYKRRKVPVPLPKIKPGVPRLRRRVAVTESPPASNDDDVIEVCGRDSTIAAQDEEHPCPLCNVMFKSSVIQAHAANCEGETSAIQTISCGVCDRVFLENKDFEVHSLECISAQKKQK